jgi:uncharacterized protein YecE (DUF72 family)
MVKIHIGTMGWSYKFWVGNFYPKNLKTDDFLSEYSKHFNTVEIDNTFYRVPRKETVTKWRDQAPSGFLFSAKFPRKITHLKQLQNCEEDTQVFIESVGHLQDKLGPLLLQFPPTFKPENTRILSHFLSTLPEEHRYAVEVRNEGLLTEQFFSLLRENNVALTLSNRSSMLKTEVVTTDFTYIRWEGDRKTVNGATGKVEVDRKEDIRTWTEKIRALLSNGVEVFGYFSKYYSGHPPSDAEQLLRSI